MDPKLRLVTPDTEPSARELNDNERAAAEVAALLEEIAARIPRLAAPTEKQKRRVRGARTVRREYVVSMIHTVERHADVPRLLDTAEARDTLEFRDAFRPIATRMAVLLESLRFTMADRWAKVVEQALQAYAMAQAISEARGREALAAELEHVARDLNRKDKPKTKKK